MVEIKTYPFTFFFAGEKISLYLSGASAYLGGGGGDSIVKHALVTEYVDSFFCVPGLLPRQYGDEAAVRQLVL